MTVTSRICIRFPCELQAQIAFTGGGMEQSKTALISNISTTGIQILSPSFVATGQRIQASFKVPGQSSLTVHEAEVMRVESLLGRMIQHYPYALGARFLTPAEQQISQIMRFIERKLTCSSHRLAAGFLLCLFGALEIARIFIHSSFLSQANILSEFPAPVFAVVSSPFVCSLLGMGLLASGVLCLLNRKIFAPLGAVFLSGLMLTALMRVIAKVHLFSAGGAGRFIWLEEILLIGINAGLIFGVLKLGALLRQMDKLRQTEKITPAANRPTFTIL